ncbi:MAG: RluA family pseudouridine synthase [Terrimicrobiaceae bacterium]
MEFVVEAGEAGVRLDRFLVSRLEGVSRVKVQAAIKSGHALLDGLPGRASELLKAGSHITWEEPPVQVAEGAVAEDIPLDILFEDRFLVVINKPAGLVVHPGAGHVSGTLVSAMLHHCGTLGGPASRPGIVHRLDRETSGCLVVAKTDTIHSALAAQFAAREVKKTYLALVAGIPRRSFGTIDAPIGRHAVYRQKMAVVSEGRGRNAITEYRVLAAGGGRSLVQCHPLTGRTHQIRVHLKHLGHPVLGDPVYGNRGKFDRHMLHAWKLGFLHPGTKKAVTFEAPPPPEFLVREER